MGKYSYKSKETPAKNNRNSQVHPVMRGIGCILFAFVPVFSYVAAVLLVNYGIGKGWPIPPTWLGTVTIPPAFYRLQGLTTPLNFIASQNNLTANIIFAIAVAVVIFGILSMLYGYMFKMMGPSQYGPTDEPPIRKKVKRYKR